ncbi:MAG TPA: ATP-binding protein [Candidatus Acidoferrum sp.]|jgi:anti-sigma regulatory factor (Ser/Thr protein kinase)|nr:ATP-binding protein [Candidatus Acidoferrum sp.]
MPPRVEVEWRKLVTTHYRATFTSDPRNVALARKSIAGFASVCGFSESEVADIRLAAGEALSNAVEHGRGIRSSGFSVACSYENDALVVEVRDSGAGFVSPVEVGAIEPDERGRGFGIFLMRRLMDDVSFGRNGTSVRLVRRHAECTAG